MRFQARLLVQLSSVFDALVIAVLFATIWDFRSGQALPNSMVALLIVPFWLTLLRFFGVYESQRLGGWVALARKVASAHFVGFTALALVAAVSGNGLYGRLFLFTGASAAFLTLEKTLTHVVLRLMRRRGFDARNVLVIGNRATAAEVDRSFKAHMAWGLRVAMLGVGPASARTFETFPEGVPAGGSLEEVLNAHVIDEVIISARPDDFVHEQITIHLCERSGVVARIIFEPVDGQPETTRAEEYFGAISIAVGPSRDAGLIVKRVIDVLLSTLLMVLFLPVLAAVVVAVKLSSAGPIIFKQTRIGLRGRRFTMFKFRTMICGAEALMPTLASQTVMAGPIYKQFSDPRVTAAGRLLRKFSLDELPQLWNVLKGEMSLVGPRPLPVIESNAILGEYRRRFSMSPGLTCIWQVNGRNHTEFNQWMAYDLQYVDRWSLGMDVKLLLQTIPAVLSGRGAY